MGYDCIDPDLRGQGLGRIIMAHRLNQAREMGVEKMRLNVKERNTASLRRFEKLENAGLLFDYSFVRDHIIAWIKPNLTLHEAYDVISCQSQNFNVMSQPSEPIVQSL